MKIVVYGIGRRFERYYNLLSQNDIVALSDKNEKKWGEKYDEKEIVCPDKIKEYDYDYVIITPSEGFENITAELILRHRVRLQAILSVEYFVLNNADDFRYIEDTKPLSKFTFGNQFNAGSYKNTNTQVMISFDSVTKNVANFNGTLIQFDNSTNVNFYTVFHKPFRRINAEGYRSISVGTEKSLLDCDYRDDFGDNIAKYNSLINEATALYWIWKNDKSDVVGLNHYRRYFESPFCKRWPLQAWEASFILKQYDIIVADHIWYKHETVVHAMGNQVCRDALDQSFPVVRDIIDEMCPEYLMHFDDMANGRIIFPCEMFVMRRILVDEYCEWLYPIVFKMIERIKIDQKWDDYSKRIIGFWTERLLTVWLFSTDYTIFELPILLLNDD